MSVKMKGSRLKAPNKKQQAAREAYRKNVKVALREAASGPRPPRK